MQEFRFDLVGDLRGEWSPAMESLGWTFQEGKNFLLARWNSERGEYGLIGFFHPGVKQGEQKKELRRLVGRLAAHLEGGEEEEGALARGLGDLCGWGLVHRSERGLRVYRDPIGRLPLVYSRDEGPARGIRFGTRPAMVKREGAGVRRSRLEAFLRSADPGGRDDFLEGVCRIRAGEFLEAERSGRIVFRSHWPGAIECAERGVNASQRIADALIEGIDLAGRRGGQVLSLSGGYDSTLLLLLMQERGWEPEPISMTAKGTLHFDETATIQAVLKARGLKGQFYDIGGPQDWGSPEVHHFCPDFGPAFLPEAAYFQRYYRRIREEREERVRPAVLVTGLGSDQLFFVGPGEHAEDLLWNGKRPPKVGTGATMAKLFIKRGAAIMGAAALPARSGGRPGPSWMGGGRKRNLLEWHPLYDREGWRTRRAEHFRSWSWEHTMRLLERYRRATGLLVELPYLHLGVLEAGLSLPPAVLREGGAMKAPLRKLLEGRVPASFFENRRVGCFDEVVWKGISGELKPAPKDLIDEARQREFVSIDESRLRRALAAILEEKDVFRFKEGHGIWHFLAVELWLRSLSGK